jgi:hypothetical protein
VERNTWSYASLLRGDDNAATWPQSIPLEFPRSRKFVLPDDPVFGLFFGPGSVVRNRAGSRLPPYVDRTIHNAEERCPNPLMHSTSLRRFCECVRNCKTSVASEVPWCSPHPPAGAGWAAFHIVTKGECLIERPGSQPVRLEAGEVLLLPHGDGHVVYGGGSAHEPRAITTTYRDHVHVKETMGTAVQTELICGRLHLEIANENLLLRTLPHVIVLKLRGVQRYAELTAMIRDELEAGLSGAGSIARDLSSALFVMLLREHLEVAPPAQGVLALSVARETARAAAAMVADPAKP